MSFRFDQPLPPRFDAGHYRRAYPELGLASDAAATAHFAAHGRGEGRIGSPLAVREAFVDAIDTTGRVLEIGPFCAPLLRGETVAYLDRIDAEALRARAVALGLDPAGCPARIDHVGSLDAAPDASFDAVVSAHAIEHQPDLVRHLEAVARVLRANGRYWLIVPDKRYCFDHFLPESTIADVLAAFEEERVAPGVRHVVEHAALVTHNDPARHWRGDHGGVAPAERDRRAAEALAAHRAAAGGYLDVHAWQFTPDGFADTIASLARLGLSAFEVEAVYDTPRDRAEFCAVLRRARAPRRAARRAGAADVVVMQTADPGRYADMLAITRPNVAEFCRRGGFAYEAFVGIRRGGWPWQATYNRIEMLADLVDRDFSGWALYLDADAYVRDLDFDLTNYLAGHRDRAAIFAESGVTQQSWDVNAGVALVNCGHPLGRRLIASWAERFRAITDRDLAARPDWSHPDDQDMIHAILRDEADVAAAVHVESRDLINSAHARFVRQRLRAQFDGFEARMTALREEVRDVMRAAGVAPVGAADARQGRQAARFLHALPDGAWLAEAPVAAPDEAAAARAIAAWRGRADAGPLPDGGLAALLDRGDVGGVARLLTAFGRSAAARGVLGGDRQHRRCAKDPAFAQARALRTHDALLSLAEAIGALPLENPDLGDWGANPALPVATLWRGIEATLGRDLSPPPRIGAYLGVEVAEGAAGRAVLHLRMIEALYAAWRIRQVLGLTGGAGVVEVGGIGLTAWYARRLGIVGYRCDADPIGTAIAAYLLDPEPAAATGASLIFAEDLVALQGEADAAQRLRAAMDGGARAFLSFAHEAAGGEGAQPQRVADLAAAGGWRRAWRQRHGTKPGYAEELFVRA